MTQIYKYTQVLFPDQLCDLPLPLLLVITKVTILDLMYFLNTNAVTVTTKISLNNCQTCNKVYRFYIVIHVIGHGLNVLLSEYVISGVINWPDGKKIS